MKPFKGYRLFQVIGVFLSSCLDTVLTVAYTEGKKDEDGCAGNYGQRVERFGQVYLPAQYSGAGSALFGPLPTSRRKFGGQN